MLRRLACAWLLLPLLASAQGTEDWKKQLAEASKKSVEVANATMASYLAKQGIPVALTLAVERAEAEALLEALAGCDVGAIQRPLC